MHVRPAAIATDVEDVSSAVLRPEMVLPVQFVHNDTNRGEKLIMLAVLEQAAATFQRHLGATTRRGQRLFREVEDWLRSDETSWPFAFVSICHALALDPAYDHPLRIRAVFATLLLYDHRT